MIGTAQRCVLSKKNASCETSDDADTKDFKALLAELEIADTDEEKDANTELNAVLENIDAILREVEEETAQEAPDTEEKASQEDTPSATDGESAESFDF